MMKTISFPVGSERDLVRLFVTTPDSFDSKFKIEINWFALGDVSIKEAAEFQSCLAAAIETARILEAAHRDQKF